jgi:hypothetical protein
MRCIHLPGLHAQYLFHAEDALLALDELRRDHGAGCKPGTVVGRMHDLDIIDR